MQANNIAQLKGIKPTDGAFFEVKDAGCEYVFRENRPDLIADDDLILASTVPGREDDRWEKEAGSGSGGGDPYASQAEAEAGLATNKAMNPLRTAQAIAALGSGGGGDQNVMFFDPDIAASAGNRYKTLAEACAAAAGLPAVTLFVHALTPFQVIAIPADSYNLSNMRVDTTPQTIQPILSFADGSELAGSLPISVNNLTIENKNTTDPLHVIPVFGVLMLDNASVRNAATATQPAIDYPVGASGLLLLNTQANPLYSSSGGSEVIRVNGGLTVYALHIPNATFFQQNNVFTSRPAQVGAIQIESYILNQGGYSATHANFVDVADEPIAINVIQHEENRVQQLVDARRIVATLSTPSRVINTPYINGSKPKAVSVSAQVPFSGAEESAVVNINIQGNLVQTIRPPRITLSGFAANGNTNNPIYSMFAIIPAGATYQVTDAGSNGGLSPVILSWHEQELSL